MPVHEKKTSPTSINTKSSTMMRKITKYGTLKILQMLCGIYSIAIPFTKRETFGSLCGLVDPETGFIIDSNSPENTDMGVIDAEGNLRPIVATSVVQMVLLAIARSSAYTMYPALFVVFFTKFRATMNFLSFSHFGEAYMYKDSHKVHVYCGKYIWYASVVHTITHFIRYALQKNLHLMIDHKTGVTGIAIILTCLLICLPMMLARKQIRYEARKYLHHLFIVFLIGLALHIPGNSGGWAFHVSVGLLVWWALDWLYVYFFMTERIQSSHFYVLPTGVQLTMAVSKNFQKWGSGGYCYVCLPWLDKNQWHAFSLFENPQKPEERQVFIQAVGDWTKKVHDTLGRDTSRPVFVQGPFASPYGSAANFDNMIIVAGGIGITPALSVIRELKASRRCNLIWATRDRHMLEFFLRNAEFDDDAWNLIFYTGKEPLVGIDEVVVTNYGSTVYVIRNRPNLQAVLPNIIHGIESGTCTPEMLVPDSKVVALELLYSKLTELMEEETGEAEIISKLETHSEELGFYFSDLVSALPHVDLPGNKSTRNLQKRQSEAIIEALLEFGNQRFGTALDLSIRAGRALDISARSSGENFRNYGSNLSTCNWDSLVGSVVKGSTHFTIEDTCKTTCNLNNTDETRHSTSHWVGSVAKGSTHKTTDSDDPEAGILDGHSIYKPWTPNSEAEEYVASLSPEVLKTWGIFYCGGNTTPLEKSLAKVASHSNIEMHSESFSW